MNWNDRRPDAEWYTARHGPRPTRIRIMAPMTRTESFVVERAPDEARQMILSKLGSMGAHVGTVIDTHIEAKTGSQLATKLKGGLSAKPTELPMRTSIDLSGEGQRTTVRVTTAATAFGFKLGVKTKYERALQATIEELRMAVAGNASEVPPPPPPPTP